MRFARTGMLVGVAAVTLMALNLNAQSESLRLRIPFAFHAGQISLPAGVYNLHMQGNALRINDGSGHAAVILCNPATNPNIDATTRVVFKGYGDTWFLSQVRWQQYSTAREIIQPQSVELELAKVAPVERVIASNRR